MISVSEIAEVLEARLKGIPDLPRVVLENQKDDGARPYLAVQHVNLPPRDETLTGDATIQPGYMQVTVVDDLDDLSRWASKKGEAIAAAFPKALSLPLSIGKVSIIRPSHVAGGYPDKVSWRVPVQVFYEAS